MSPDTPLDAPRLESLRPLIDAGVLVRTFDDEAVAWSARGGRPIHLSPVAQVVFSMLDGSAPVGELIDDIHDVVGVPRESAADLMARILAQFESAALLATSPPTWPPDSGLATIFPAPHNH